MTEITAGGATLQDPTSSLVQLALGITPPWEVDHLEFDAEQRRLDIHVSFTRGSKFACPDCGAGDCPVHDVVEKEWRHLNFFQHEAYLHAGVPRVRCGKHGVHQVNPPWTREGSGFSLLFEALAMLLMREMPVKAAARHPGEAGHPTLASAAPPRRAGASQGGLLRGEPGRG